MLKFKGEVDLKTNTKGKVPKVIMIQKVKSKAPKVKGDELEQTNVVPKINLVGDIDVDTNESSQTKCLDLERNKKETLKEKLILFQQNSMTIMMSNPLKEKEILMIPIPKQT
jgi:hypothetical protein